MHPYGTYGWTSANTNPYWWQTSQSTIHLDPHALQGAVIRAGQQQTDWERAKVKAEPDDEFSWLRKRVREIEDLAFA